MMMLTVYMRLTVSLWMQMVLLRVMLRMVG